MAVTSLFVLLVAAAIAVLLSVFPLRGGPESIASAFFRRDGTWRRSGRLGWFVALLVLLVVGLWVTPRALQPA
jgi:hypothetical protein